jgi:hypothetical protein
MAAILGSFNFAFNKTLKHTCHSCQLGKHVRLPFTPSESRTYFPFQLVHADVWTSPVLSFSGFKYHLVLLDDFTHYAWTFPIRLKSEVLPLIRSFLAYVHTQFRLPLVALQTDNGKEFNSHACAHSSRRAVLRFDSPARIPPSKTGKQSEFFEPLTIVCVHFYFIVQRRRHFG